MRTPVPKSRPIIQRRFGIRGCPSLTMFMTPSTQRTTARDRGRLKRAEYAQMPLAQPTIFGRERRGTERSEDREVRRWVGAGYGSSRCIGRLDLRRLSLAFLIFPIFL